MTSATLSKMKTQAQPDKQPMDRLLFWLTFLLLGVGIVTVFDASYAVALEHRHDTFYYIKLQAAWAAVGLVALRLTMRVPYWRWRSWAVIGLAVAAILLVAVLVPHIGINVNGARRWVGHGPLRIQPSEFAKLMLVLYLAHVTSIAPKIMHRFQIGILPPLLVIGFLAALIAKEPDLGTALVVGGTGLIMLFLAGARPKHLALVVAALSFGGVLYGQCFAKSYQKQRLEAWINPRAAQLKEGYQVWHGLVALGSGGVKGLGLGEGVEKLYIPEARTDFIFAVIAEEWGLIGTLVLVVVFVLVAARGYAIAYQTKDTFGGLLAAGITTMITLQALINMAVATGSIPDTGVPLPFISYGGTSLVLMMAGMGLLLNISCYPNGPEGADGRPSDRIEPNEDDWNRRWERGAYRPTPEPRVAKPAVRRLDRARRPTYTGRYDEE